MNLDEIHVKKMDLWTKIGHAWMQIDKLQEEITQHKRRLHDYEDLAMQQVEHDSRKLQPSFLPVGTGKQENGDDLKPKSTNPKIHGKWFLAIVPDSSMAWRPYELGMWDEDYCQFCEQDTSEELEFDYWQWLEEPPEGYPVWPPKRHDPYDEEFP